MFSKNPSKESLRQMLQAQCDNAMLLDNSVRQLYAAEPAPSRSPYRPKKKQVDAYQQEIERLSQARDSGVVVEPQGKIYVQEGAAELDIQALEKEAAEFMRNRCRK